MCAHIKAFERRAQIAQTQNAIAMLGNGAREVEVEGEEERENAFLTGIVVCTGTMCNCFFFYTGSSFICCGCVYSLIRSLCMVCSYFATVPNPIKKLEKSTEK